MPIIPTYPGVYVEEIPSGVHTITGVSTSVTAFVGQAKRGPANNRAQNILSFADFERTYGGLLSTSYMTYAVRQFFLNGGSNAWVIRVAKNAKWASHTFPDSAGSDVLKVTALDAGTCGNDITVKVEYPNPDNGRFNLTIFYTASDNPADTRTEQFSNLSMDPNDPRYVKSMVNDVSQLVTVTVESAAQHVTDYTAVRPAETATNGMLTSGVFSKTDFDALPNATYNSLQISLDGSDFETISIPHTTPFAGTKLADKLNDAAGRIQALVQALHATPAYQGFTCVLDSTKTKLVLTSGTHNPGSSVQVKPAAAHDIANQLHLLANEATISNGTLTSGAFSETDFDALANATYNSLQVSLDGYPPATISIEDSPQPFIDTNPTAKLADLAQRIQTQVRLLKPGNPAYQGFTCTPDESNTKLVLISGSPGPTSSVQVKPAANRDITGQLHLLTSATSGSLTSGTFSEHELDSLPDTTQNSLQISLDGSSFEPITITGGPFTGGGLSAKLTNAAHRIRDAVRALHPDNPAYQHFTCTPDSTNQRLVLTSGTPGPKSSVQVNSASSNDIATQLHLLPNAASGSLTSGVFSPTDLNTLPSATQNSLQFSLNGSSFDTITITGAPFTSPAPTATVNLTTKVADAAQRIQTQVRALKPGNQAYQGFTCTLDPTSLTYPRLVLASGTRGPGSSVQVSSSSNNDITNQLHLFTNAMNGPLTSGAFSEHELDTLPDATQNSLQISLDGSSFEPITITGGPFTGGDLPTKLADAANRIRDAVRALHPDDPAYQHFTCTPDSTNQRLVLTSGTPGPKSSVRVKPATTNDIANQLHLLTNATADSGHNTPLTGGSEDAFSPSDYSLLIGDRSQRTGIYALEDVDLFNLLCLPGVTDGGILMDAAAYCQERRAFLIIDAPQGLNPPDMVKTITGPTLRKTNYAAIYYPWVSIADPLKGGKQRMFPPSGTIAGVYARIDSTRGVWKAPAGTEASLVGVQGAELVLTDGQNGILNPHGVNCLRVFPVYGPVSWGARTLRGDDQLTDEYKYIPVRRLALYIEESLYRGTKWAVFEPNDEPLWSQIRLNVGAFMNDLFRKGAFQGRTPRQAYLVKCDSETTTQNDINLGIVNILVGFAPLKPAEFVIIQIQQLAGQIQV